MIYEGFEKILTNMNQISDYLQVLFSPLVWKNCKKEFFLNLSIKIEKKNF